MSDTYIYYWDKVLNLGDQLTPYIIKELQRDGDVVYIPNSLGKAIRGIRKSIVENKRITRSSLFRLSRCYSPLLFSVGSILSMGRRNTTFWGSGFMNSYSKFRGGKVCAVRGPLSRDRLVELGYERCDVFGDPALLLPIIIPGDEVKSVDISIIPHWTEYDYFRDKYGERYNVIDLKTADVEGVISQITSSRYILSTSLHGVIIAHAYGVPALWIKCGYISTDGFKFRDYFASVGIRLYDGFVDIDKILESEESYHALFDHNKDIKLPMVDLLPIQRGLLRVAPFELKDEYRNFCI